MGKRLDVLTQEDRETIDAFVNGLGAHVCSFVGTLVALATTRRTRWSPSAREDAVWHSFQALELNTSAASQRTSFSMRSPRTMHITLSGDDLLAGTSGTTSRAEILM